MDRQIDLQNIDEVELYERLDDLANRLMLLDLIITEEERANEGSH